MKFNHLNFCRKIIKKRLTMIHKIKRSLGWSDDSYQRCCKGVWSTNPPGKFQHD